MNMPAATMAPVVLPVIKTPSVYKEHAHVAPSNPSLMLWEMGSKIDVMTLTFTAKAVSIENELELHGFKISTLGLQDAAIGSFTCKGWQAKNHSKKHAYQQSCSMYVGKIRVAIFEFYPTYPTMPEVFRARINFAELERLGVASEFMVTFMPAWLMGHKHVDVRVKYIEYANDVPVNPSLYLWFSTSKRRNHICLGTFYDGLKTSPVVVTAYDKAKHMYDVKGVEVEGHVLRVEVRLRKLNIPLSQWLDHFSTLPNPLLRVHPVMHADVEKEFPVGKNMAFWNIVTKRGLACALAGLKPKHRQKMLIRLKALPTPSWWNPKEMWGV